MKSRMVSYRLDVPEPVTEPELDAFKQRSSLSDEQIGAEVKANDVPELTPERWRFAFPGMLRRFVRTHVMTKADGDVIRWLRAKDPAEAEQLVNDLLRREMEREQAAEKHAA